MTSKNKYLKLIKDKFDNLPKEFVDYSTFQNLCIPEKKEDYYVRDCNPDFTDKFSYNVSLCDECKDKYGKNKKCYIVHNRVVMKDFTGKKIGSRFNAEFTCFRLVHKIEELENMISKLSEKISKLEKSSQ